MRLFVEECKKEIAANFHRDAFEDAIEKNKENHRNKDK
jgi:hypothetical protein